MRFILARDDIAVAGLGPVGGYAEKYKIAIGCGGCGAGNGIMKCFLISHQVIGRQHEMEHR